MAAMLAVTRNCTDIFMPAAAFVVAVVAHGAFAFRFKVTKYYCFIGVGFVGYIAEYTAKTGGIAKT